MKKIRSNEMVSNYAKYVKTYLKGLSICQDESDIKDDINDVDRLLQQFEGGYLSLNQTMFYLADVAIAFHARFVEYI